MIRDKISLICSEDPALIENYDKAINDMETVWILHHRYEVTINGEPLLSSDELKTKNLYYHRPASELIFLTPYEHGKLHSNKNFNNINQNNLNSDDNKNAYREYQKEYRKKHYARDPEGWKDYVMKRRYVSLSLERLKQMLVKKEKSIMDENKKERLIRLIKEAIEIKNKETI